MIRSNLRQLERELGAHPSPDLIDPDHPWIAKERILPHALALTLIQLDGQRRLTPMRFSLLPSWSKEKRVKFATHNARIETVLEKPTWKRPFLQHRCVIPMTDFIEPVYEGKFAGNMVAFHQKSSRLLLAAGIWETWKGEDEIIESFAILTGEPDPFVAKSGHDRTPIFLSQQGPYLDQWLTEEESKPEDLFAALKKGKEELDLEITLDRPLRPGWEKRR